MAFRPSYRSSRSLESVEINLMPVMNLMVVLIPLLLSTAEWIKIGVIELNLPPAIGAGSAIMDLPKETEMKLDLAVTITDKGFIISSSMAILKGEDQEGPSIPMKDGTYDFQALSEKLYEIKAKARDKYLDTDRIIIQAEPEIPYQTLVSTMDASRAIIKDDQTITLFPEVSLAAGVL